jgi:hypothetical protein
MLDTVVVETLQLMPSAVISWRGMASAPRDRRIIIEVKHGIDQEVVRARYNGQARVWVRDDDIARKALSEVVAWRPLEHRAS